MDGGAHDEELDWFGHPLPPSMGGERPPVPCPYCSEQFLEGPVLRAHLVQAHGLHQARRSPLDHLPPWLRSLGFLPLWFVLPMTVGLVALVYLVVRAWNPWIAAYCAALATFPLVLVLAHRVFSRRA